MFRRWLREYSDLFFKKGNALDLAIGVIVATQFQQIVDALTKDLLMPLLNPLMATGNWKDFSIPYFGGSIEVGLLIDMVVNSLLVGWALFVMIKVINRARFLGGALTPESKS